VETAWQTGDIFPEAPDDAADDLFRATKAH
jgi:hypothetical protein